VAALKCDLFLLKQKKKGSIVFKSVYKWKLKIGRTFFLNIGNFRECRTSIPTTLCSDFIALVPDTHQLWWFFSRWLISLKWVQPLCHCLISLSLDWFSH